MFVGNKNCEISESAPPAFSSAAVSERRDAPASTKNEPDEPAIYVLFPVEPLKSGQILDIFISPVIIISLIGLSPVRLITKRIGIYQP